MGIRKTIPADQIQTAMQRLAEGILASHSATEKLVFLGIAKGGVPVCQRLAELLEKATGQRPACGVVNVSFHRDDIGRNPIPDMTHATDIPEDLDETSVVLVDDVLCSGRTARAALEEVFANGRPARVQLAVLVDRGNHRLPIVADHVGLVEETATDDRVTVKIDINDPAADTITISNPA